MKDSGKTRPDSPQDGAHGIVKPRGHSHTESRDASQVSSQPASHPHADAAALSAPELSHPANAAPLADLLGQLQQSRGNVYVQRVVSDISQAKSGDESQLANKPQNLDAGVRTEMESAFGENFGDVRIHTDSQAEKATEELGARAFTRERDIYFSRGVYNPTDQTGKETLAHELAHVVQQRGGAAIGQASSIDQSGDAFEREADQAAAAVTAGRRIRVTNRGTAPALQRQKKDEPQKKPEPAKDEAPEIVYHSKEITSSPLTGTINAAGKFSIAYGYLIAAGAEYVPLTLTLSEGVSVTVVPLTTIGADRFHISGSGRTTVLSVLHHLTQTPVFQISFTKGSFTYVVTFKFPSD